MTHIANPAGSRRAFCVMAALLLAACGGSSGPAPAPGPDRIDFTSPDLQPEGVAFDPGAGQFVVGSSTRGTIHHVSDTGDLVLLTEGTMTSTLGLEVDEATGRVLAAGETGPNNPALGSFDLGSGATIAIIDLSPLAPGPSRLANDVALSPDGRAFVTDTFAGVIYEVEPEGTARVFLDSRPDMILPNGIVSHPDGFLLVATLGSSRLLRVPLDDPAATRAVRSPFDVNGDGMVLLADGTLAVVGSALGPDGSSQGPGVTRYASMDGWMSAERVSSWVAEEAATTGALRAGTLHVVYAGLFDPTRETYAIVKTEIAD